MNNDSTICSGTDDVSAEQNTSSTSQSGSFFLKPNRSDNAKLLVNDSAVTEKFLDLFGTQHTFQIYAEPEYENGPSGGSNFTGSFESSADKLIMANNAGYAICFMVNEGDGKGRSGDNVTKIRAIYVDLDGPPIEPILECKLPPHIIVCSSPGKYHAYWLSADVPIDKFGIFQNALIARFDGDDRVKDLPRVMRVPGFYHLKEKPVMSNIYQVNDLPLYSYEELVAEFPPVKEVQPKAKTTNNPEKSKFVTKSVYVDGERTSALTSHLGHWFGRGKSLEEVETLAYGLNYKNFRPPLSDQKVDNTIRGIYKTDQRNNPDRNTGNNQHSNLPTDLVAEMQKFNEKHAVVEIGGKTSILKEKYNPDLERIETKYSSVQGFYEFNANKNCLVTENGNTKEVNVAKQWMKWSNRPTYEGVTFAPGRDYKDYYNLFRGFAVEGKQGVWSKMKGHIKKIICAGNEEHAKWLIAWMAHIIQYPGGPRPGTTPVLLSEQGAGKGIFVSNFGKLFGSHYLQITQRQHITGNFNDHLRNALFVFCDEGIWGGDKQAEGVLKGMITDDLLMIEPKCKDVQMVKNYINMIVASNERWAIPADIKDRRYFVLDVSNARRGDIPYFKAIAEEMESGGLEAMYYDLLNLDISDVNLRKAPKTDALMGQIKRGFSSVESYWFECLSAGSLDQSCDEELNGTFSQDSDVWPKEIMNNKFYSYYAAFAKQQGYKWSGTMTDFFDELRSLCPIADKQLSVAGKRPRGKIVPDLEEARSEFCKQVEIDIEW